MFFKAWKQILHGKTLMRALMNTALAEHALEPGRVLDIGGGKNPSYLSYFHCVEAATIINIDKQHAEGAAREIDFEKDALPFAEGSVDQVLCLNVLEHVYHHQFLVGEMYRVLKSGKQVIGFVPFLINYHPDPHDYFRYTDEALKKIFQEAGFSAIEIQRIGLGPFAANFNNLASFMPRVFNALLWPFSYALDRLVLAFKPNLRSRFPLGYLFILTK